MRHTPSHGSCSDNSIPSWTNKTTINTRLKNKVHTLPYKTSKSSTYRIWVESTLGNFKSSFTNQENWKENSSWYWKSYSNSCENKLERERERQKERERKSSNDSNTSLYLKYNEQSQR